MRLLRGVTFYVVLGSTTAAAVEVVTTAASRAEEGKAIDNYKKLLDDSRVVLQVLERQFRAAALESDVVEAFKNLTQARPITADMATPSLPDVPSDVSTETTLRDARNVSLQKAAFERYDKARKKYLSAKAFVDDLVRHEPSLESLKTAPSLQVNTGRASANFVPAIDFVGMFDVGSKLLGLDGNVQFLFNVRPEPASSDKDAVAQSIRINTGVFTGNIGLNVSHFKRADSEKGSQGFELRVGVPVSYQRASSTATTTVTGSNVGSDFGLFSPEVKVSIWLRYVLVGYKFNYYVAFGGSGDVYSDLNHTGSHKAYLAARIDALSAKADGNAGVDSPFYVEATYTGGKNSFHDGTFSIAFSKVLSWPSK